MGLHSSSASTMRRATSSCSTQGSREADGAAEARAGEVCPLSLWNDLTHHIVGNNNGLSQFRLEATLDPLELLNARMVCAACYNVTAGRTWARRRNSYDARTQGVMSTCGGDAVSGRPCMGSAGH